MKTLKSLSIIAAVTAVFATVSCTKEDAPSVEPEAVISTITLSIEQPTDESATKTQLGTESTGSYPINWTLGTAHTDAIAVGTTSGTDVVKYTLTGGGGTTTGKFSGTEVTGAVKAFYPYGDVVSAAENVYNVNIPAVQTYTTASSFGEDAMPMYAVASSTNDLSSMKPLMSVLKITLSGSCTVKRIVVSNESEKLSGSATVTYTSESASLAFASTGANDYVELVCTDGVDLSDGNATFHIVVPATTATSQYTVRVVTDASKVMTKKFTPKSKFTAAKIKNLTNVLAVSPGDNVQYVEGSYCGDAVTVAGYTWAPVNCGYEPATTSPEYKGYPYGKLYQWGRKCGLGYDTSYDATAPTGSSGPWTGTNGEENSNTFYIKGSGTTFSYDWIKSGSNYYWNSATGDNGPDKTTTVVPIKTTYDPCPTGWRVPTYAELNALTGNSGSTSIGSTGWDSTKTGYWFKGLTSPVKGEGLFLPAAGDRGGSDGDAYDRGSDGGYWSSSVSGNFGRSLYFNSSNANMDYSYRANGYSVRCVQE